MPKTILFDLDGTIIDSYKSVLWGLEQSLTRLEIPIPHELYLSKDIGNLFSIIKEILPHYVTFEEFKDVYDMVLSLTPTKNVFVTDETKNVLKTLKQFGYNLVVLTNKRESIAKAICISFFESETFTAIIGRDSSQPIKPYPQVFKELEKHNISTVSLVCLIGDSEEDYKTAVMLGIPFYDVRQNNLSEICIHFIEN